MTRRVLLRLEKHRYPTEVWVSHAERHTPPEAMPAEKDRWNVDAWLQQGWHLIMATDRSVLLEYTLG